MGVLVTCPACGAPPLSVDQLCEKLLNSMLVVFFCVIKIAFLCNGRHCVDSFDTIGEYAAKRNVMKSRVSCSWCHTWRISIQPYEVLWNVIRQICREKYPESSHWQTIRELCLWRKFIEMTWGSHVWIKKLRCSIIATNGVNHLPTNSCWIQALKVYGTWTCLPLRCWRVTSMTTVRLLIVWLVSPPVKMDQTKANL